MQGTLDIVSFILDELNSIRYTSRPVTLRPRRQERVFQEKASSHEDLSWLTLSKIIEEHYLICSSLVSRIRKESEKSVLKSRLARLADELFELCNGLVSIHGHFPKSLSFQLSGWTTNLEWQVFLLKMEEREIGSLGNDFLDLSIEKLVQSQGTDSLQRTWSQYVDSMRELFGNPERYRFLRRLESLSSVLYSSGVREKKVFNTIENMMDLLNMNIGVFSGDVMLDFIKTSRDLEVVIKASQSQKEDSLQTEIRQENMVLIPVLVEDVLQELQRFRDEVENKVVPKDI
jgi:hypothetical protein